MTTSAADRLAALLAAEVGPSPTRHNRAKHDREPRPKAPLPPPAVDHELWIKTADVADLGPLPVDGPSWDHQVRAYWWALPKKAAYLDFGMGAGKSRIAVALAAGHRAERVLILCPKSVVSGWPNQFRRHGMHEFLTVALDKGSVIKRVAEAQKCLMLAHVLDKQAVVVMNYEAVPSAAMQDFIKRADFDFIVFDEAPKLKSHGGLISKTAHRLFRHSAAYKLMLSGTPLPHSPLDIFAQMRILDESVLGTAWTSFRLRYSIPDPVFPGSVSRFADDPWINKEELAAKLAPFFFHVGREVLDLPPAHHIVREVTLGAKARKLYKEIEDDFYAEVEDGTITAANALTRMIRFAQLTSGFIRLDESSELIEIDDAKRVMLDEILDELPGHEKVVVFARFTHDLAAIRAVAEAQGRRYGEVSGQRNDLVESRYPEDVDVLGVQIQSGGVGVDFSSAAICVYWSLSWSLGEYDQSLARVHRPGQTRSVTYVHLVAKSTIDERVYKALDERRDVVTAVLERMSS